MATRLKIDNFPSINVKALSRIDADAVAGATTITPESIAEFATNDFVYLGNQGNEQAEKRKITVASQNFTVVATTYAHKRFEGLTAVKGDQIQVYRAPNVDGTIPGDGTFVAQGSPIDIAPDQLYTDFIDTAGGSGYWYKWVFYNSNSVAEVTYLSDMQAQRGDDVNLYTTPDEVRQEAGFRTNKFITDQYILSFIVKACDEVDATLFQFYTIPFADPVPETLRNIAKTLAAGYLLKAQYGVYAMGTNKDGGEKVTWAQAQLQLIVANTLELFDQKGSSLRTEKRVQGWPDDSTASQGEFDDNGNPTAGGGSLFNISHRF